MVQYKESKPNGKLSGGGGIPNTDKLAVEAQRSESTYRELCRQPQINCTLYMSCGTPQKNYQILLIHLYFSMKMLQMSSPMVICKLSHALK